MQNQERYSSTVLWLLAILILIVIVAVVIAFVLASSTTFGYGMMGGMMGYGAVFMVIPIIVIIVIIVAVISLTRPSAPVYPQYQYPVPQYPSQSMTPLKALELRYARGEITREQYEQIRSDLENRGSRGRG